MSTNLVDTHPADLPGHPHHERDHSDESCIHCRLHLPFKMPEGLVDRALRREVVIFAGAGISTEVPEVFPTTIFDMAASRLEIEDPSQISFPELMELFQNRFGRTELAQMIKKKFDYIDCFPFLRNAAREFHYELATMPFITEIVTTNWDTYFEEECGATPIVSGEDVAFYGLPGRKLLKIHGSIAQIGSVVATESDYSGRLERLGSDLMGGLLRSILATKTVIFIGYSLKDWNFRRLYDSLRGDLGQFAPNAYVVNPFENAEENEYGMKIIKTSGVHFLRELKRSTVGHCVIDDSALLELDSLWDELGHCNDVAKKVSVKDYPAVLFTWFYHDGMRDALSRISHRSNTGEYSDRHIVTAKLSRYDELQAAAERDERWGDVAYIDGYINVLMLLLDDQYGRTSLEEGGKFDDVPPMRESLPMYFVYGSDSPMRTEEEFHEAITASRRRSPKTRKYARERTMHFPDGMVTHHPPFLQSELAE